jgi:hypothetical protein
MKLLPKLLKWSGSAALVAAIACSERGYRLGSSRPEDIGVPPSGAGGGAGTTGGGAGTSGGGAGTAGGPADRDAEITDASRADVRCSSGEAGQCGEDIRTATVTWTADVILIVDSSSSMREEMAQVQEALNAFAARIASYPIDLRILLLAEHFPNGGICVPPPLGSGDCPPQGSDSALPRFFHHPTAVLNDQNDVGAVITSIAPELSERSGPYYVGTFLVIVSDGNGPSRLFESINSVFRFEGWLPVYALYAFTQCPTAREEGHAYRELINRTTRVHGDLCTEPVAVGLNRVAEHILAAVLPGCTYSFPPSTEFDAAGLNLAVTVNGTRRPVDALPSAAQCDASQDGWYPYDSEQPAFVLCPATCERIRQDQNHRIHVPLGCSTIIPPC